MRLLIFDIDGTILDSGGAGSQSLNLAFQDIFSIKDAFSVIPMAGKTDVQIIKEGLAFYRINPSNDIISEILSRYEAHLKTQTLNTTGHLKPGISQLLKKLSTKSGYSLGLLTGNIQNGALIKLGLFHLNHYFSFGAFGSDHEDRNKLLPIALSRFEAITKKHVKYSDCVIIGDTPRDVECARPYGAATVAVATGPYSYKALLQTEADLVMHDLSDHTALLNFISSSF